MKKTIKAALKGITTATAGFLKKRGIYVVALALIARRRFRPCLR